MKKLFLLLSILALGIFTYAQNTGDVCIIGMNSDNPDKALLVTFTDIASGTVIYLTDNSWNGSGWSGSEGFKSFTLSQDWTAGQVVELDLTNNAANPNIGTVQNAGGTLALSTKGDQLYVYLGSDENTPTTFLFAVNTKGGWATGELDNTGLTDGTNALSFASSTDDIEYTGSRSGETTFDDYKTLIADVTNNWATSGSSYTFDLTDFVTGTITPTKLEIYSVSDNPTYKNWEFNVIVRAVDDNGDPGNVTNETQYQLNTDGTGSFTGGSGTIAAGTSSDTITVSYDAVETFNMTASKVSGDNLATSAAVSMTINPLPTKALTTTPDTFKFDDYPTSTLHDLGWYTYAISGPVWYASSYNSDHFMKITNYPSKEVTESWVVLPKFTGGDNAMGSFSSASYSAATSSEFKVKASTDYPGYGNPNNYTWTDLTFTLPVGNSFQWVKSGSVDLSSFGSDFYLAFVFTEPDGQSNTLEVDSMVIYNNSTTTGIHDNEKAEFIVYPNPVSSVLYVNAAQGILQILDNTGRIVKKLNINGHANVNVADLAPGIYFARLRTNEKTLAHKFIKR